MSAGRCGLPDFASGMSADGAAAARELYARVLALEPDHLEAAAGLAAVEAYAVVNGHVPPTERKTRLAEAHSLASRVLAAAPGHAGALRARAVILRAQGRFEDAIVAGEAVLAQSPGDPPTCREIGLNRLYLGAAELAVQWFLRADAGGPGDPARWTWMQGLGRALMHLGRDMEAASALRAAVESRPGWLFGQALLAAALLLSGDAEGARERYAEFARLVPDRATRIEARQPPVPPARVADGCRRGDARIFAALDVLEDRVG